MTRRFAKPYIVFYPIVSRDGGPLPINRTIREWQQMAGSYVEAHAWRGNIVVARYCDNPFNSMVDVTMADFPMIKNFFLTAPAPPMVRVVWKFVFHRQLTLYFRIRLGWVSLFGACSRLRSSDISSLNLRQSIGCVYAKYAEVRNACMSVCDMSKEMDIVYTTLYVFT